VVQLVKDFVYHACGLKTRLKSKFFNSPHHLPTLLSDYRVMAKWFGAYCDQEVRFSSAVKCKKGPQVLTSLLNQEEINIIILPPSWTSNFRRLRCAMEVFTLSGFHMNHRKISNVSYAACTKQMVGSMIKENSESTL